MKVLDLFSGIGGFSLGFERAGFKTVAFCEIDEFCQKILAKHWPEVPIYSDVSKLDGNQFKNIDIITGGFPCQDLSSAGKQTGINEGTRSGLWWEMRRLISEIRPKFAIMENVPNFLSGERGAWFGEFLKSLAEIGYDAEWSCVSAGAVGKPHLRERMWIVAYAHGVMRESDSVFKGIMPESYQYKRCEQVGRGFEKFRRSLELLPANLRVDDGVSFELDEVKQRVKACGNSIVPEIAYLIAEAMELDEFGNIELHFKD